MGAGRSATARVMTTKTHKKADRLMLDSGCTSHMTPLKDRVDRQHKCDQKVSLADDSSVTAKVKGVCTVKWQTQDGIEEVRLSETLVVPDLAMSLLSVPALVRKNILSLIHI